MLKFQWVEAENFLLFDSLKIDLGNGGLTLIEGNNTVSSYTSSNEAGKTDLLSLISSWLFDVTPRGEKADAITKWGKEYSSRVGQFEKNGQVFKLARYRKHPKYGDAVLFSCDGKELQGTKKDTQQLINQILGMDFDLFLLTHYYTRSTPSLLSLQGREKSQVFETILQLNKWSAAQEKTKKKVIETQKQIEILTNKISMIKSNKAQIEREKVQLDERCLSFDSEKLQSLLNCENTLLSKKQKQEELNRTSVENIYETDEEALRKLRVGYEKTSVELTKLEKELVANRAKAGELSRQIDAKSGAIADLNKKLNRITTQSEVKCFECGQLIKDLTNYKVLYENKIKTIEQEIIDAGPQITILLNKINQLDTDISSLAPVKLKLIEIDNKLKTVVANKATRQTIIQKLLNERTQVAADIKNLEIEKARIEKTENTYVELIEQNNLKLIENEASTASNEVILNELSEKSIYLNFLVNAFGSGGVKSFYIDTILPALNKIAQNYCQLLTNGELLVQFSAQKELKSGDNKEEFTPIIYQKGQVLKYNSCSSGQQSRINIITMLALSSVGQFSSFGQSNLLIFDETFDCLDNIGVEMVVKLLNYLKQEKSTILVTAHSVEVKSLFDNVLVVTRNSNGSQIGE